MGAHSAASTTLAAGRGWPRLLSAALVLVWAHVAFGGYWIERDDCATYCTSSGWCESYTQYRYGGCYSWEFEKDSYDVSKW